MPHYLVQNGNVTIWDFYTGGGIRSKPNPDKANGPWVIKHAEDELEALKYYYEKYPYRPNEPESGPPFEPCAPPIVETPIKNCHPISSQLSTVAGGVASKLERWLSDVGDAKYVRVLKEDLEEVFAAVDWIATELEEKVLTGSTSVDKEKEGTK